MKFNLQHQKKIQHVLLIIIGSSLSIFWLIKLFEQNIEFYMTPSELLSQSAKKSNLYLGGYVKPSSLVMDHEKTRFLLQTKPSGHPNPEVMVHFQGILPDLFQEGEFAIAIGKWSQGILMAQKVLAKHDENYQPKLTN